MRRLGWVAAALVLVGWAAGASAMFMIPPKAPVDRLIKNLTAYIKENPKDAAGYYTLARVHFLAFSLKTAELRVIENNGKLPYIDTMFQGMQGGGRGGRGGGQDGPPLPPPTDAQRKAHVLSAVENYDKAIAMDAKNGLYRLGLASLLESAGAEFAAKIGADPRKPVKGELSKDDAAKAAAAWKEMAVAAYWEAYSLAIEADLKLEHMPIKGINSLVSHEAGSAYVRIVSAGEMTDEQKKNVEKVKGDMVALGNKKMGPVTPIVFSMEADRGLDALIDPAAEVRFDMDGTGRGEKWPWVKCDTAILVWNPTGDGRIDSGRQLFGSVTWWIFWTDGYRALDALDDNRDGKLAGSELAGLAVWTDRNGDGISSPGEVTPIERTPIAWLATRATGHSGRSPMATAGIGLRDERVLPTYDWVVESKGK